MKWCNKALFKSPIRYGLCLEPAEFAATLSALKHEPVPFLEKKAMAATHTLEVGRKIRVVVCMNLALHNNDDKVWSTLLHEAIHVWQAIRRYMGETDPATEQEAYCIEQITSNLVAQYRKATGGKVVTHKLRSRV